MRHLGLRTSDPHSVWTVHVKEKPSSTDYQDAVKRLSLWVGGLDSPALVAALTAVAAIGFVIARLELVAHGDISRFIDVGSAFSNPAQLPHGVAIVPGGGYDGEFYYRLALDPADLHRYAFGITLDNAYRLQRITYSVLAWLTAGGQQRLVPYSLVAVNVLALTVLAWLSGALSRASGRKAIWGLLIVGYFGFLFSLGRDLTEICEACFVVAGLLALRHRRPVLAGGVLAAAVLSRETALVVVAGVAFVSVVDIARRRRRPGWWDVAWLLPVIAYVGWQLVGLAAYGSLPLKSDSDNNLTYPLTAMVDAIGHYFQLLPSQHAVIWIVEAGLLMLVASLAAVTLRISRSTTAEKVAWAVSVLFVLCLSRTIWYSHADFRGFEDVYVLSVVILLGSDRRLGALAGIVTAVWLTVFVHRVLFF